MLCGLSCTHALQQITNLSAVTLATIPIRYYNQNIQTLDLRQTNPGFATHMTNQSDVITTTNAITVRLDNRIRLMSSMLAATDFPEQAQRLKPHGTHAHSRATRKYLQEHISHPAVLATQALIDQGTPLEALFTAMLHYEWPSMRVMVTLPAWVPSGYGDLMREFYEKTNLGDWWEKERFVWDKANNEAQRVFGGVDYKKYLLPYLGEIPENMVFVPNISFPTDREIGVQFGGELICIAPPPMAWGDSPPWPYDEQTMLMHSYRVSIVQFVRLKLIPYLRENAERVTEAAKTELPVNDQFRAQFPAWEDQFTELFVSALVAMYLEEFINEAEYKSFVLMERKVRGMNILPGTVSVMRRYLQERGNKYDTLIDFLPLFPKQLRVAKRIVTL